MSTSDLADQVGMTQAGPLRRVLHPIRGQLIIAVVLSFVGAILTLTPLVGIAHIAQIIIDNTYSVSAAPLEDEIWLTVVFSVVGMFVGMTLVSVGEWVAHVADNRITYFLRTAVMQRLSRVPLGWFTNRTSGEVKQVIQDDIATLHSLTAHFYTAVGRAVGVIVVSGAYLFALDWRLAIITSLPFIGFFLFLRHAMKASQDNMSAFATRLGEINSTAIEFIRGIPVIKAFGAAGRTHEGYRKAVDGFADAFIEFTRPLVGSMSQAHAMIAPVTILGVVLAFGALFVDHGMSNVVDLLPFLLVAPGICAPLLLLHTLLHALGGATSAAQRVLGLLNTPVLPTFKSELQSVPLHHEVRFDNVGYSYAEDHRALSNVSFTLQPGYVTAVVGASGSGKSTLARLLLRFFDPQEGRVLLGGIDLRHMDTQVLYQNVGFVLQDVCLVHASLRENIALGRPSANQKQIEDAAKIANIHECIMELPRGYDAVIGEDARLSGGEEQRVSIARAVLLDAPILVLDEATAAADVGNEIEIQHALSRFAQNRSVLVIAHRLDTIMDADHIVVLEEGVLVEQGTHEQLLARGGRYQRLWIKGDYARDEEEGHSDIVGQQGTPSC